MKKTEMIERIEALEKRADSQNTLLYHYSKDATAANSKIDKVVDHHAQRLYESRWLNSIIYAGLALNNGYTIKLIDFGGQWVLAATYAVFAIGVPALIAITYPCLSKFDLTLKTK